MKYLIFRLAVRIQFLRRSLYVSLSLSLSLCLSVSLSLSLSLKFILQATTLAPNP